MNRESGQVTIFAALMLIVFVSVAAFCMNAAYAFHQHTQMQADIDTATLRAAGTGCTAYSSAGISIRPSPTFGPYAGNPKYCGGTYTKQVGSLFGKIMPVWFPISVQAVARHGGSTEPPFAFLGLSPDGISHNCSVLFAGSSTITVTGNVLSNSSSTGTTDTSGKLSGLCENDAGATTIITQGAYLNPPPQYYDPFATTMPVATGGGYTTATCGSYTCYTPTSSDGVVTLPTLNNKDNVKLLPYNSTTPGLYIVANNVDFSPATLVTQDSVVLLSTGGSIGGNSGGLSGSGGWSFSSPDKGMFKGYSLYQEEPCVLAPTKPSSQSKLNVSGGFSFYFDGLLDLSCADVGVTGGSGETLNGAVVGKTVSISGSGTGTVFQPAGYQPPRGAFLVQ